MYRKGRDYTMSPFICQIINEDGVTAAFML